MLQKPCFMGLEVFRVNRIRMGEKVADSQKINTDRIIRSSFAEQKVLKKGQFQVVWIVYFQIRFLQTWYYLREK